MTTTYQMDVNELTVGLIDSIKAAFGNKKINIIVSEADLFDETEYLLSTKANRDSLEKSMQQAKDGDVVVFTLEEFQNKFGK